MTDIVVKSCAQKGLAYVIYPKANIFWLLVNYFTLVLFMKSLLFYGRGYLPQDIVPDMDSATFSMYMKVIVKHFLSVILGLPLLVAVAKSILNNDQSSNYYAYFNKSETWRLFSAHLIVFILVGMPSFILIESFVMTFANKTPDTLSLDGPAIALMSLTYMLILSLLFFVVFYFISRLILLYIHVATGKRLDIERVFDATRGEAWKIFVTLLISGLPVMIFTFFTTGNMFFPSTLKITRQIPPLPFGADTDFIDICLSAVITVVIAFLAIAPFAALCYMYEYIMKQKRSVSQSEDLR